jgi:hypothetical protein
MARRSENSRHSKYVIRIVCEGDKTEPLFFTDLCDTFYYKDAAMDVRTIPQPPAVQEEEATEASTRRGSYQGKKRKVNTNSNEEVKITGAPPLKWVSYARQILSEGVDESWAVYDKDEHPLHKEAVEEANREVNGKKVNIAFSSRSFEYYLLLHFEYLYYRFEKTECGDRSKGNKHIYECGTGKHPEHDCHGKRCINGYAREHGYWKESKSSVSTFPLVKDRLLTGIVHACRLRSESDRETNLPFYERNPYTNVDHLVGRLIGYETVGFSQAFQIKEHGHDWSVMLDDNGLTIENRSSVSEIISKNDVTICNHITGKHNALTDGNIILILGEVKTYPCQLAQNQILLINTPSKKLVLLPKY